MTGFIWISSGFLQLTGADHLAFLHGQTSNDVRGLNVGDGSRSLILNAKGQIEFDLRVYRRPQNILTQTSVRLATDVMLRLKRYIVFDDVQIQDVSETWRVVHVLGDEADGLVSQLGFEFSADHTQLLETDFGSLIVSKLMRGCVLGFDVIVAAVHADALQIWLEKNHAHCLDIHEFEQGRVLSGLSDIHADGFVGMLPQECGLESAVSYRKGCYIGQEIMARLQARGHTNKHLVRVKLSTRAARGSNLMFQTSLVGILGTVVSYGQDFTALAVVRKSVVVGTVLKLDNVDAQVDWVFGMQGS